MSIIDLATIRKQADLIIAIDARKTARLAQGLSDARSRIIEVATDTMINRALTIAIHARAGHGITVEMPDGPWIFLREQFDESKRSLGFKWVFIENDNHHLVTIPDLLCLSFTGCMEFLSTVVNELSEYLDSSSSLDH